MDRRQFIRTAGALMPVALAGCTTGKSPKTSVGLRNPDTATVFVSSSPDTAHALRETVGHLGGISSLIGTSVSAQPR